MLVVCAPAPAASAEPLFGFNDSFAVPPAADEDRLNLLEARAGAEISRLTVSWADVDHDPDKQEWAIYDRRIQSIRDAGMKPLIILQGSPAWARPGLHCFSRPIFCPPDAAHLDDWEHFSYQVAERYPDAVAFEVWNEPNWRGAWQNFNGPNPEHYAAMFKRSVGAVRFAVPSMPVLIGSLTYSLRDVERGNMTIPTWLRRFALAGGASFLRPGDGIGIHAYPWTDEMETLDTQFAAIMKQIREQRNAWTPGAEIWVTETGATTTGPHPVTERQQARTIVHILNALLDDNLGAVLVHTSVEPTPNPAHPAEEGSGVLKWETFAPKPAYCVLLARAGTYNPIYPGCPTSIFDQIGMTPKEVGGMADDEDPPRCLLGIQRVIERLQGLQKKKAHWKSLARAGDEVAKRRLRAIRVRIKTKADKLAALRASCPN